MPFILFDTEYIADRGFLEEGFNGWQNREIIQIGALKISDDLQILDTFNYYIKPKKHKYISDYFSKLTGITNDIMSEQGLDFPFVYKLFKEFVGNCKCYSHGWSFEPENDSDGEVMREMLNYYKIEDFHQPIYKNIAFWFREQYKKKNIKISQQASGEIASLLGVSDKLEKLHLQPHNALYDVYSIWAGLKYLGFEEKVYL